MKPSLSITSLGIKVMIFRGKNNNSALTISSNYLTVLLNTNTYYQLLGNNSQVPIQTCNISSWLLTLLTKVSSIFALLVATVLGREEEGVIIVCYRLLWSCKRKKSFKWS